MVRTLEARENITTDSDCNGTSEFHTSVRGLMILCNYADEGGIEVLLPHWELVSTLFNLYESGPCLNHIICPH